MKHLDEGGEPCTRHPVASSQGMLALALLGSRMPSFHHDVASKLQTLMMALEELAELAEGREEMVLAVAGANATLRELEAVLKTSRALARAPRREPIPLDELVTHAAERAGVNVKGALPACHVAIALPSISQALAVLLDLAAGPLELGRTARLVATVGGQLVLVIHGAPTAMDALPANAGDMLALTSFALAREGGELRCGPDRFTIHLPLAIARQP